MAEETNPLSGVLEQPAVETPVVETPAAEPTPQAVEYSEVELRAMDMGWKPLDQWEGDKSDHRSAKEYIDRGELLGKLKQTNTELRELKAMVSTLSEHNRRVHEEAYKQAIVDLKKAKVEALRNEDHEAVVNIDEQLASRKQELQVVQTTPRIQPQAPEASPVFQDWLSKNSWYTQDEAMQFWANGEAIKYAKTSGRVDEAEIYKHLHEAVRKEFPNKPYFRRAAAPQAAPSPDGSSRRGAGGGQSAPVTGDTAFKNFLGTLPREEAFEVEKMVKRFDLSPEQFMRDYELVNKRGGR